MRGHEPFGKWIGGSSLAVMAVFGTLFTAGHGFDAPADAAAAPVTERVSRAVAPTGVFPILSKERYNVSEKYGNAPMPWTLRLTRDGVAIHGGSEVERGYASHGCIGSPDAFVSRLFAVAKVGDKVIITRGKIASIGDVLI